MIWFANKGYYVVPIDKCTVQTYFGLVQLFLIEEDVLDLVQKAKLNSSKFSSFLGWSKTILDHTKLFWSMPKSILDLQKDKAKDQPIRDCIGSYFMDLAGQWPKGVIYFGQYYTKTVNV